MNEYTRLELQTTNQMQQWQRSLDIYCPSIYCALWFGILSASRRDMVMRGFRCRCNNFILLIFILIILFILFKITSTLLQVPRIPYVKMRK